MSMHSAKRSQIHIEEGCPKLRGRRRTASRNCSWYAFVVFNGAPVLVQTHEREEGIW